MKRVVFLGMPNTGKSTLFNRLTGARAKVGNWPGMTVDFLSAKNLLAGQMVEVIDLPGIYDLAHHHSEDERVVTEFLQQQPVDLILLMMNAGQIERQLPLLTQVAELGRPTLLVLNMEDEAHKLGIKIDPIALSKQFGIPVCLLSAKYGQGLEKLQHALHSALHQPIQAAPLVTPQQIDEALRSHAIAIPAQASDKLTETLDKIFLHPWLGLPIFFMAMLLMFTSVFILGKPIQDSMAWLFDGARTEFLEPLLSSFPPFMQGFLLDGLYNGVSTVATFIPLIILFFWGMAIIEDTGYLSRAAFLMDAIMSKFGLDGRSFVMILMGFGCNVPALLGTRVIRSRGLRLLTMLIIPLSLCSARLQVFLFFIAALFPTNIAPLVLFSLYLASLASTLLTAILFKPYLINNEAFVLEVPPYRFPTLRQMLLHAWHEVRHFITRATRFIVLGVIGIWLLTHLPLSAVPASADTWAGKIGTLLNPIFEPLGINPKLTLALIFGFVAKEVVIGALAVIYASEGSALMAGIANDINWIQGYSFMLFALIYTPCLSTIVTLFNESKNIRFSTFALLWPLVLAWLVSFIFYQTALLLIY
jgi:ferrous iron transport protein B